MSAASPTRPPSQPRAHPTHELTPVQYFLASRAMHSWSDLQIRLLWAYDGEVLLQSPGQWQVFPRPLTSICVLHGQIQFRPEAGGEGHILTGLPGDAVIVPAGRYAVRIEKGTRVRSVGCEVYGGGRIMLFGFCEPLLLQADAGKMLDLACLGLMSTLYGSEPVGDFVTALRFNPRDMPHHAATQSALWTWFQHVATHLKDTPTAESSDSRVLKLLHLLESHPLDAPLHPLELEQNVGLSWRRLEQLFKAACHMTPSAYLDQRRALAAYRRLASTDDSVKAVAYLLGFKQPSHFSRWFSQHFGMSPSAYRQELKGRAE